MELVLQQKQTLQLVMTTELRQAINLLQYSTYELYQFIQEQHYENPLIELTERTDDYSSPSTSRRVNVSEEDASNPIDFIADEEKNMFEMLLEQVMWLRIEDWERELLHYLILNLDEHAFLPLSEGEIANDLSISQSHVERGIELLQQLEPIGVGARNVAECLTLQLKKYYPDEEVTAYVVRHHLDLLASKKWTDLTKLCDLSHADLQHVYDRIRTLDPNPGMSIIHERTNYVQPDIMIEEQNGTFKVFLNDDYLPDIRFNRDYIPLLHEKDQLSSYVNDHYKKYQWLMNSIEQRRSTILKITEVVIRKQQDFFKEGFSALQPLTLNEVAEEIGMHESTVSRATMNKMIQTPKGSFSFRKLFASKMEKIDGTSLSQVKVKFLLQQMVDGENKTSPLSDQKIADDLKVEKGVTISRRTVAKYREELQIPSSRHRKELKR